MLAKILASKGSFYLAKPPKLSNLLSHPIYVVHICMYIHMCICMYVCISMYVRMYTYIA